MFCVYTQTFPDSLHMADTGVFQHVLYHMFDHVKEEIFVHLDDGSKRFAQPPSLHSLSPVLAPNEGRARTKGGGRKGGLGSTRGPGPGSGREGLTRTYSNQTVSGKLAGGSRPWIV
jgi:hypothetical protein